MSKAGEILEGLNKFEEEVPKDYWTTDKIITVLGRCLVDYNFEIEHTLTGYILTTKSGKKFAIKVSEGE